MKVDGMTKEQLQNEMKKTIKVRAIGDRDIYVGYYNHLRRRGGDVFILRPVIRERFVKVIDPVTKKEINSRKKERLLITAEMQFSQRWMEKVNPKAPETPPTHFNLVGRGRKRLDIPGMTNKVGGNDQAMIDAHDNTDGYNDAQDGAFNDGQETTAQDAASPEDVI